MSGNSTGDEPNAKRPSFKPSKETLEKMQPLSRAVFTDLWSEQVVHPLRDLAQK